MEITFIFIAQKDERVMVKRKLCPGQKQLYHAANTTLCIGVETPVVQENTDTDTFCP